MSDPAALRVAGAVAEARRYRDLDPALVRRLAQEELPRAKDEADAVKRVKRRLHEAVNAYRPSGAVARELSMLASAWSGSLAAEPFRGACRTALTRHASTRERLPHLETFYETAWRQAAGAPSSVLDLGCGRGPLSLPWMGLAADARYEAVDVDRAALTLADGFLALVGQPHRVALLDLSAEPAPGPPTGPADCALLLKLVPLLDRRDPRAAARLIAGLDVRHAVVSFPLRSLGGRARGMERANRERLETLVRDLSGRVSAVAEASVPNELVFVLTLTALRAPDG